MSARVVWNPRHLCTNVSLKYRCIVVVYICLSIIYLIDIDDDYIIDCCIVYHRYYN